MRVLLDTHTFLWFITADERLSTTAEEMIRDNRNEAVLSVASVWEMAIKVGQGRLPIPLPLDSFIPEQLSANRIGLLPIDVRHTFEVARLELWHRDPFDRLLIAQSMVEKIPIISADGAFDSYSVEIIW